METFSAQDWLENFRMKKEIFLYLCSQVRTLVFCTNTRFRKAISVELRVGITLWCLATPCEYRTVAHLFGVHRWTVCIIVYETYKAIVETMMEIYTYI